MDFEGMMAGYSQFFGTKEQTEQARPHHGAGGSCPLAIVAPWWKVDVIAVRPK